MTQKMYVLLLGSIWWKIYELQSEKAHSPCAVAGGPAELAGCRELSCVLCAVLKPAFSSRVSPALGSLQMLPLLLVNESTSHCCLCAHSFFVEVLNQMAFAIIQVKEKQILFIITCYGAFFMSLIYY